MLKLTLLEADFSRGVVAIAEVYEAEVARLNGAALRMRAYLDSGQNNQERFNQLDDDLRADYPIWRRISGVHFWLGEEGLAERRAGLKRLIGAVEAMYRGELALRAKASGDAEASIKERNPGAPAFYDPVREICRFLEMPLSKLSQLCLELTGLRIQELGDAVRAEGFRATLTEKLRPLVTTWRASLREKYAAKLGADSTESGWQFLKWVRGRGRAGNRKKWA